MILSNLMSYNTDSLHIHCTFIKQELFDADVEDAVVIVPGDDVIFDYNNLFKGIADAL